MQRILTTLFFAVIFFAIIFCGAARNSYSIESDESDSWKSLDVEEQSFIRANPTLTVLVNSVLPPYTFIEDGELQGYWIDLLHIMFRDLPVKLRF